MTEIREIRHWEIQDIAETLVRERGTDFVYKDAFGNVGDGAQCRNYAYIDGEITPMCIVGTIIHRLNPEWLKLIEAGTGAIATFHALGQIANFSPKAKAYLRMAQKMQDRGYTWNAAIYAALCHADMTNSDDLD